MTAVTSRPARAHKTRQAEPVYPDRPHPTVTEGTYWLGQLLRFQSQQEKARDLIRQEYSKRKPDEIAVDLFARAFNHSDDNAVQAAQYVRDKGTLLFAWAHTTYFDYMHAGQERVAA